MDHHIEPSKIGLDLRDERTILLTLNQIDVIDSMLSPRPILHRSHPLTRQIALQIGNSHASALARKRLDYPAPYALRTARHQHSAPFKSARHTGYRVTLST